ncbi:hypothetical protein AVEN_76040-1 [Araneus ventricosus]|uniref:Uncharacterized protein n=1 Tax=Araneus ventricosus TaxID=182803 RepID=A0A4Y2QTJ5_ARAVE|nr:hypothetical protein AVEN_92809-1 [Araneus ventricosus]GBN66643.1 hypothetical protein AVEN_76040-1 [Araneus ventricosus]
MKKLSAKQSKVSKESFLDMGCKDSEFRACNWFMFSVCFRNLSISPILLHFECTCSERLLGIVSVDDNSTGALSLNVASSVVINSLRKDDYSISKSLHYIESYAWPHRCVTLS